MNITDLLTVEKLHNDPSSALLLDRNWDEIPLFVPNLTVPKDGMLYKFRGMIQDMSNPVYYFSKYEVKNKINGIIEIRSGKYMDSLVCGGNETIELESASCENGERRPYFLVPIPALSPWVTKECQESVLHQKHDSRETVSHSESKRPADEMEVDDHENEGSKRLCSDENVQQTSQTTDDSTNSLNDPSKIGCLAFMYDVPESSLKLNDVLEVVGFLYLSALPVEEDEFDDAYKPPSPLTPRLHSVTFRKITNLNPLVKSVGLNCNNQVIEMAESTRADLRIALSQLFFGDTDIADYIICHLISQIYHRDDNGITLGKFSLNISSLPRNFPCKRFYDIIAKILPKVQFLSFTVDELNYCQLLPKKNYKTGLLETGLLQLSDNTHLVIDEISLKEGKLLDAGVRNVTALSSLIKRQKLDYDFTYYSVGFDTDIPVLTLSRTKSILPADYRFESFKPADWNSTIEESFESVNQFLNEDLLNRIRMYLTVASTLPFSMPQTFNKVIQDEFVSMRQRDSNVSADDLHELLILARFLSLSYCKTELDASIWSESRRLFTARKSSTL